MLLNVLSVGWHSGVVGLPSPLDIVINLDTERDNGNHCEGDDDDPLDGEDSQANDCCHLICQSLLSMASSAVNKNGVIKVKVEVGNKHQDGDCVQQKQHDTVEVDSIVKEVVVEGSGSAKDDDGQDPYPRVKEKLSQTEFERVISNTDHLPSDPSEEAK